MKHKKSWLTLGMIAILFVFIITFVVLLIMDKNFRDFKSLTAVLLAAVWILALFFIRHKTTSSWGDEIQKTIQLEIFSYTFVALQFFLTLFVLLEIAYRFKMEPMEVLITILLGMNIAQLAVSFFVKRKYK
ncbi:MAG: hypothetical protein M1391_14320 [Bacteroidetes bacterium]|nr:hypothetical protein [Bacteroidota bacterium]